MRILHSDVLDERGCVVLRATNGAWYGFQRVEPKPFRRNAVKCHRVGGRWNGIPSDTWLERHHG